MNKYCCDKLSALHGLNNEMQPNFRVIKLDQKRGALNVFRKNDYVYAITFGYKEFDFETPKLVINYCPFCGNKLSKYYNTDQYINEVLSDELNG